MCTSIRFTDNSGHMYLGRNLDWSFDYGQQVRVMPRGFHIPYSFIDDATAAHAVIGMCIDYRNYPMFFDKYEQAPKSVQDKVISDRNK